MSISTTWSRVVAAVALAAGATCFSMTSASADSSNGCFSLPETNLVIDSSSHPNPAVAIAYTTNTANGKFYGSYGTNWSAFDLGYDRYAGSTGSITVYFEYWYFRADGGCNTTKSPTYTISTGIQNYKFSGLSTFYGAYVAMYVQQQNAWVALDFR